MKSNPKNIITSIAVLAIGAAAGTGLFFGVQALLQLINSPQNSSDNPTGDINRFPAVRIDRNYQQEQNFNLIEYQYKGQYFLGQAGLELLNKQLNERLPFGPEIDQLKYISFNHPFSLPNLNSGVQINGQYNPFTMELDIDTRRFLNGGFLINSMNLEQRVEFIFTIILHEYGHHLANSYMTAIEPNDPETYNNKQTNQQKQTWVPTNRSNLFIEKNLPNSFFSQWEEALNYNNDNFKQAEMNQQQEKILYKSIPSKRLYDAANHGWNLDLKEFTKDPSLTFPVGLGEKQETFTNANLSNLANYAYGIDELLTRHFVTFNYLPKTFPIWSTAIDAYSFDAILRNQMNINNLSNSSPNAKKSYTWDNNIFAVDNIFGGTLKQTNKADVVISSNVQKILNAYKDVVGEGKLINQIFFNNSSAKSDGQSVSTWEPKKQSERDFNKIKIGGYIPKNNPNKIKGLVFEFDNGTKEMVRFEHVFTKTKNLHTKERPDAKTYAENNDNFDPYITEEIDLNSIRFGEAPIIDIQLWADQDNNNNFDQTNETQNVQQSEIVMSRPITTFRESFQQKQRVYTPDGSAFTEGMAVPFSLLPKDFLEKELIYKLKWSNGKILLEKKKVGSTN